MEVLQDHLNSTKKENKKVKVNIIVSIIVAYEVHIVSDIDIVKAKTSIEKKG